MDTVTEVVVRRGIGARRAADALRVALELAGDGLDVLPADVERLAGALLAGRLVLLGPVGQAMHWAHAMLQPQVSVLVGLETTGLDSCARIVEVAAVNAHDGSVALDTLLDPGVGIPPAATAVHRITDTMVAGLPGWDAVLPQVLAVTRGRKALSYNAFTRQVGCRRSVCRAVLRGGGGGRRARGARRRAPGAGCGSIRRQAPVRVRRRRYRMPPTTASSGGQRG